MNNFYRDILRVFASMLVVMSWTTIAAAQNQTFQLDDIIKADLNGRTFEGKVFSIKSGGKYLNVTFYDGMGNTSNRTIPAAKATLVRRAPPKSKATPKSDKSNSSKSASSGTPSKSMPAKPRESAKAKRWWTKNDGEPYFEGTILDQVDGLGRFERADGEVVEIELKELSIFDRILLNKLANKVSPNAFAIGRQPKGESGRKVLGNEKEKYVTANYPFKTFVANKSKFRVFPGVTKWSYQPDGLLAQDIPDKTRVPFDAKVGRKSKMNVSPDAKIAALQPDLTNGTIHVADLVNGKEIHSFEVKLDEAKLVGVNSKAQVFTLQDKRLDVWDGTNGKHLLGLGFRSRIKRAECIDSEKLLVTDQIGNSHIIDVQNNKHLYSYKEPSNGKTSFSPGKKFFAIGTKYGVAIARVSDGEVVGSIQADDFLTSISFSPTGTKLVAARIKQVFVWDLVIGKLTDDFEQKYGGLNLSQWIDEDYVLFGNSNLVSTRLRSQIWNLKGVPLVSIGPGLFWAYLTTDGPAAVLVKLPDQEMIDKIGEVQSGATMLLEPGTNVKIQLDLPFSRNDLDKVFAHFKKQLGNRECTVSDNASIVLRAYIETGKRETKVFGDYNPLRSGTGRSVSYVPKYCRTVLTDASGRKIWERVSVCEPHSLILLGRGETLESKVQQQCTPSPNDYTLGRIPKYKPIEIKAPFGWLGSSGLKKYEKD